MALVIFSFHELYKDCEKKRSFLGRNISKYDNNGGNHILIHSGEERRRVAMASLLANMIIENQNRKQQALQTLH